MNFWIVFLIFAAFAPLAVWGLVGQLKIYYPRKEIRISERKSRNLFTRVYVGYWYPTQVILILPICFFAALGFTATTEQEKLVSLIGWGLFVLLYLPFAFAFFFPKSKR